MAEEYVDKIFKSFRSPTLSKQHWLDGDHGWRSALKQIGEITSRITQIHNVSVARLEWQRNLQARPWMRSYLIVVPLLDQTAVRADYDDEVFRQFMRDLATLAKL